jgi:hypothetical protein
MMNVQRKTVIHFFLFTEDYESGNDVDIRQREHGFIKSIQKGFGSMQNCDSSRSKKKKIGHRGIRQILNELFTKMMAEISVDHRCDDRRFCLSAHDCQVPTPTYQNLATTTANLDLWSRLTHQFLGRLKSTIPNRQICLPKKVNSEKLRLGIDNPCRILFLLSWQMNKCLERVNDRHFWNPGVFSYAMIPRCRPNERFFFHRHIYSPWKNLTISFVILL